MENENNDAGKSTRCTTFRGTEEELGNFIFGDSNLSTQVSQSSKELFFDGKQCGANAVFDSDTSTLVYEAKLGTFTYNKETEMFFNSAMIPVPIKCKYMASVDSPAVSLDSLVLDKQKKEEMTKVAGSEEAAKFAITSTVAVKQPDGPFDQLGDGMSVALGEETKITFASSSDFEIHIASCVAGDDPLSPVNSIDLITDDCFLASSTGPLSVIRPLLGDKTINWR